MEAIGSELPPVGEFTLGICPKTQYEMLKAAFLSASSLQYLLYLNTWAILPICTQLESQF